MKNNGLIFLVEEISRQPNIGSVLWLLVFLCRYAEEKNKQRKAKYKMYRSGRKRAPGNLRLENEIKRGLMGS